jgi:hypothetical protein
MNFGSPDSMAGRQGKELLEIIETAEEELMSQQNWKQGNEEMMTSEFKRKNAMVVNEGWDLSESSDCTEEDSTSRVAKKRQPPPNYMKSSKSDI